jgi:hypothetical protein
MANKVFAERLNIGLDNIGLPSLDQDRIEAFARLIKAPKFKAESILHGEYIPGEELLEQIASELEVNVEWLLGKTPDGSSH